MLFHATDAQQDSKSIQLKSIDRPHDNSPGIIFNEFQIFDRYDLNHRMAQFEFIQEDFIVSFFKSLLQVN